jgi:hypothetical protein
MSSLTEIGRWIRAQIRETGHMSTPEPDAAPALYRLRTARVIRVYEDSCQVWSRGEVSSVRFASMFPTPRMGRVFPGHLVALATGPSGVEVVVWRWFDAVVLDSASDGPVRLWEPAHGEVIAKPRPAYVRQDPGSRAYASAGLPGAEWWVAHTADGAPDIVEVDLNEVHDFFADNDLWPAVFQRNS